MRHTLPSIALAFLLALALAGSGPGCASAPPQSKVADETTPARIALTDFVLYFSNKVEGAADNIAQEVADPAIRRSTVFWKMRVIPLAQNALLAEQDDQAILQIWILAATMTQAFDGALGEYFGKGQSIAVDAAKELEARARNLAKSLLKPELFDELAPQVDKVVKDQGTGMNVSVNSSKDPVTWGETLSDILSKPIDLIKVPVSSLNPTSGLSDTAIAMQNFTDQFSRARTEMMYMPQRMRWQLELLLMEAEESVNISGMANGVAQMGSAADSMAATAKDLPTQLRTELTAFVEELDRSQGELQGTLKEANTTLTSSRETAQAIDTMAATLTRTFGAFDELMVTLGVGPDDAAAGGGGATTAAAPASEGPPFDINDYGRTAEKLTETANALSALLEKTDALAQTPEPPPLLVDTEASARALLDRFFIGSAALIVFGAAVGLLYRKIAARQRAA